jgi:acetoin utilization protein AcuB
MIISDIMTTNVVSVPSHTSLAEARRIMEAHGFSRLPVIDRGKLLGIVTKGALDRTGPSELTTFSLHEITSLLDKYTVKDAMRTPVVTVTPEMTVEEGIALAQSKKVGSLVVVEGDRVVGICTTKDFFYRILNPILGIGMPGSRIVVRNCFKGADVGKVIASLNKIGADLTNLFITTFPEVKKHDLVVHIETGQPAAAIEAIKKLGFTVEERAR